MKLTIGLDVLNPDPLLEFCVYKNLGRGKGRPPLWLHGSVVLGKTEYTYIRVMEILEEEVVSTDAMFLDPGFGFKE